MRPDVTSLRHWLRETWDGNRAFTTASLAALLGLLALATAAGAFGGPAAAAEPVPTVAIPGEFGHRPDEWAAAPRVSPSPLGLAVDAARSASVAEPSAAAATWVRRTRLRHRRPDRDRPSRSP